MHSYIFYLIVIGTAAQWRKKGFDTIQKKEKKNYQPSNPLLMLDFVDFAKIISISFRTLRILTLAVVVSLTVCCTDNYKFTYVYRISNVFMCRRRLFHNFFNFF